MKTLSILFLSLFVHSAFALEPVFDMHTHYKWSQREVTTPEQAIEAMDKENIEYAVVIGKPAKLALEVKQLAPERIIAFFSPYRDSLDWFRWQRDEKVLEDAREALESGNYQGIGELHVIGGFSLPLKKAKTLHGLMKIAAEHDAPIMLHTEFSRPNYILDLCKQHPKTRIIWAHSGAILEPPMVDKVLATCPNLWGGMAARDPWRYIDSQHTDENGKLLPEWKELFLKYPDRFMVGSDTVWPVEQADSWDEPDTGWINIGKFWTFHRSWVSQLPDDVASKILRGNALKLFNKE